MVAVGCVAIIYLSSGLYSEIIDGVLTAMQLLDGPILALVLLLSLVNYVLRFGRWVMYIGETQHALPLQQHLAIYIAGFALTVTPTKAGEAIRILYLRPFGVGYRRSFAALYAERVMDLAVISILAALILISSTGNLRWLGLAGAALAAVLLLAQHPAMVRLGERLTQLLPSTSMRSIADHVVYIQRELVALMTPKLLAWAVGIGLLAWGAEGLGLYLVARELGVEIGLLAAIGIYATAVLAGALTFLPGGIGGTELVMTSLLISTGASPAVAIATTAVVRIATLWFAVALGAAAWLGIETFASALFNRWGRRHSEE